MAYDSIVPARSFGWRGLVIASCLLAACGEARTSCRDLTTAIRATYSFRPSQLSDSQQAVHAAALDNFWTYVKAHRSTALPCLRSALSTPSDSGLFLVDGSNLLVSLDSSTEAKTLQVHAYSGVRLDDVDLRGWVGTLAQRGVEGFDISTAGFRWLHYPHASFNLPEHGGYVVERLEGALYLYGSMPESLATPALLRLVSASTDSIHNDALYLLMSQATPEAIQALRGLQPMAFDVKARSALTQFLKSPPLFQRRTGAPHTSRAVFLQAFDSLLADDWSPFLDLADSVADGERDVVTVMRHDDIPLLRRVRRRVIAAGNQHATDYYDSFTRILLTMIWDTSSSSSAPASPR